MSEQQFQCVNCNTELNEDDTFSKATSISIQDLDFDDADVICKDCSDEYANQLNRMAVEGVEPIPPNKGQ